MIKFIRDIYELEKAIDDITTCFYQQRDKEGYHKLELVFPDLLSVVDQVALLEKEKIITKDDLDRISTYLSYALQALEKKDIILLSDIMRYDLMEALYNVTIALD